MMNKYDKQKLISSYYDGALTPEEKELVEQWLIEDKSAQEYYKSLQAVSKKLKQWSDEDLSPDLNAKIYKTLQENKEGQTMKKTSVYKSGPAIVLATLLIVGVVSLQNYKKQVEPEHLASNETSMQFKGASITDNKSRVREVYKDDAGGKKVQYESRKIESNMAQAPVGREMDKVERRAEVKRVAKVLGDVAVKEKAQYAQKMNFMAQPATEAVRPIANRQILAQGLVASYREGEEDMIGIPPLPYPYPTEEQFSTEQYNRIYENQFLEVSENPLSTFSIDVDTASYSNLRRFLNNNQMPPADAVRIEEMINYFTYDYPQPKEGEPFSITTNAAICPWNKDHHIVQIGLQGKSLDAQKLPPSNLVFLIDVSGSMNQPNKLPLLKNAFKMLVNQIGKNEKVAIVVYAGAAGEVLKSTSGADKYTINQAIDRLHAGGSTAGGAGIELAYKIAKENFIKGGNNRVILATDGDFNVGVSSDGALTRMIEKKRKEGIFLTILGFGTGNYKDSKMEQIANKGNGNYYYIDTQNEAKKVLVHELGSTLFTIAKDVKLQLEFNPSQVKAYRLIGYENRILAKEDFNNDKKDAGELGAGHNVTALYEIVPADSKESFANVDPLKYQEKTIKKSDELLTVKLRYKEPDEEKSKLITHMINIEEVSAKPAGDFKFVTAVAEFGLLLRNSEFKAQASYPHAIQAAEQSKGNDKFGYRKELIELIQKAKTLDMSHSGGIQFK